MNNIKNLTFVMFISVIIILIIKPFVDDYKQEQKYDFKVNTINGELTKKSLKGKAIAVYFGYTYCPDVCPTGLSSLAQALNSFDKEKTKDFVGLFISVDPDRDTLKNLNEYSKYFHPSFIGATSNKTNIDDIIKRYESYYKKMPLNNSAMGYSISHSSFIYFFDKNGKLISKADYFSDSKKIEEILKLILED